MLVNSIIQNAAIALNKRCGDRAIFEARVLLGIAIGNQEAVYPHMNIQINEKQERQFYKLIVERINGKPISRIRGWREFWSHRFKLNESTLDPRPESELLVEKAVFFARSKLLHKNENLRLLDLGTGSGCLLLSCLSELEHAVGIGIDISQEAIIQARENAQLLKLKERSEFFRSNWFEGLRNLKFDIILCNPPYISREEKQDLQDEVLIFDPEQALFSDKKGLADYEIIFSNLAKYLNSNGIALIEIGYNQLERVSDLAHLSNLHVYNVFKDLQGIPRCMILCRPNNTIL